MYYLYYILNKFSLMNSSVNFSFKIHLQIQM